MDDKWKIDRWKNVRHTYQCYVETLNGAMCLFVTFKWVIKKGPSEQVTLKLGNGQQESDLGKIVVMFILAKV